MNLKILFVLMQEVRPKMLYIVYFQLHGILENINLSRGTQLSGLPQAGAESTPKGLHRIILGCGVVLCGSVVEGKRLFVSY